jgi:signal transduction histidine kinase
MNQMAESHKESAEKKGLRIFIDIADTVPQTVTGDSNRLQQILKNLLNNAIKFTSKGNIVLHAERIDLQEEPVKILFEVRDPGIGIAPGKLDQLFNPFTQVDESSTRVYGGIGLGLAVCKLVVKYMGGEIGVRSVLHEGSTFWFYVPFDLKESNTTSM